MCIRVQTMPQRLKISLPDAIARLLDRVAPRGDRSRYIDQAVRERALRQSQQNRRRIKEGAIARYDEDRQVAEEWLFIEEEAWQGAQPRKR